MMQDITQIMNNYRECSRHIWNTYFMACTDPSIQPDMFDNFKEIQKLLFGSLVLSQLEKNSNHENFKKYPMPFFKVIPIASTGVPIYINRPSSDSNQYWDDPVNQVLPSEAELNFIDYFDWDVYNFIDLNYYLVSIASFSKHPHLIDRKALIETTHARVFYDDSVRPPIL